MSARDALRRWRAAVSRSWRDSPSPRDVWWCVALGLAARLGVVAWAGADFPPADDGHFYHVVATRIAQGLGYTWLWPDGAVTYAAHYPVGYPALIGGVYAALGADVRWAMALNALLGAASVWAVHRVAAETGLRGPALVAGLVAALHPGFVFYTPALMTEGVTAALLAITAAVAVMARRASGRRAWLLFAAVGLLSGVTCLIRPQTIVLAPVFGAFAVSGRVRARLLAGVAAAAVALVVCLPWTARNCARLERCVFVSANGGWNLLIGSAEKATGRWVPLDVLGVPPECRTVFAEAEKDRCFGLAGLRNIREAPGRFLALVPKKLAATFDWSGAPGHYLNASNPTRFDYDRKITLGVVEALVERLVVLLGLVGVARARGPFPRARLVLAGIGAAWLFHEHAWVAFVLLVAAVALGGARLLARPGATFGASVVAATAVTHAVFFGDGRYGLVTGLVLVMFAAEAFHPDNQERLGLDPLRALVRLARAPFDRANPAGG